MAIDNSRHYNIISKDSLERTRVIIIGAGAGGSWATYFLAKLGITDIIVYDYDIVEAANVSSQCFDLNEVGAKKVLALKYRIKRELKTDITAIAEKVTKDTEFDLNMNTIVLNMVDNINSRGLIHTKLKGIPIKMIDARMGGEGWQIRTVDCADDKRNKEFEESLEGEFREMPCGEKAVIYSTVAEVAEIVNIVKRIIKQENHSVHVLREMSSTMMLGK